MTNETIVFNFNITPYLFEDLNTTKGPVLKNMLGDDSPTSETYCAYLVKKIEYNDDSTGTSTNWANSLFNPLNDVMGEDHCIKLSDTANYSQITSAYTIPEFQLVYNRITGTKGFTIAIAENDAIRTTVGDDDYPLQAIFLYKKNTNYLIAYAIAATPFTITGNLQIPFITDTQYGKVLTTVGKNIN